MRVLMSIGSVARETGGPARSSQGLAVGLERCGCETWLLSHTPGEQAWMPGVAHFLAAEKGGYAGSVEAVERAIATARPDVIHSNGLWLPYTHAAVVCARRHRLPLVIAPRGTLAPWALAYKKWKKRLAWWLYQRGDLRAADAFHVTSQEEAAQVRAQGLKQPIILLPNGVDLPELAPPHAEDGHVRTVLYLGRIHFQKGLRELIQAWAILKQEGGGERVTANGVPWRLELVGPDVAGHQAELIAEAERLGLKVAMGRGPSAAGARTDAAHPLRSQADLPPSPPDILFTGPLDDDAKWGAYARADLVVLPSYTENFGLTVAEGLAAGKPVITTKGTPWAELLGNAGGSEVIKCGRSQVRESVTAKGANQGNVGDLRALEFANSITSSGRCGWWIEIGAEPLVQALQEAVLLNDEQRARMGQAGQRLVEARYSWMAISADAICAFKWMLKGGDKPSFLSL